MNNLYGWVFAYNPYTKQWYAAKREDYYKLWNEKDGDGLLKSGRIETLVELIVKFNGDKAKIEKMIERQKELVENIMKPKVLIRKTMLVNRKNK